MPQPRPGRFHALAGLGFSVFPINRNSKKPLLAWKKYQESAPTFDELEAWEHDQRQPNVGIATGAVSGIVVVDVDTEAVFDELEKRGFELPGTPTVRTGRGHHFYFAMPSRPLGNGAAIGGIKGLDIRGQGGYVVGPGSLHETGRFYEWETTPDMAEYAALPSWVFDLMHTFTPVPDAAPEPVLDAPPRLSVIDRESSRRRAYCVAALRNQADKVRYAGKGERNAQLFKSAAAMGEMVCPEMGLGEIRGALLQAATEANLVAEDGQRQTEATIESGIKAGAQHPKRFDFSDGPRRAQPAQVERGAVVAARDIESEPIVAVEALPESQGAPIEVQPTLTYLDLAYIAAHGIPAVDWLIPNWIARRDIVVLAGRGGIGKSTLVADLAQALARGRSWCGALPSDPMTVLYIDEEQGEQEAARLLIRLGGPHENLHACSMQGLRLDVEEQIARLEAEVKRLRPSVVIVDSFQQFKGATDENSEREIGLIFRALFRMRDTYGTAFIILHHITKMPTTGIKREPAEMIRGSSAILSQVSAAWVASPSGPTALDVVVVKRRGGAKKVGLRCSYHAEDSDGAIELRGEGTPEGAETAYEAGLEEVSSYLLEVGRAKRAVIVKALEGPEISARTIDRALKFLVSSGIITSPTRGVYASKYWGPDNPIQPDVPF